MYPLIRVAKEAIVHRSGPPLTLMGEHRSRHICWPWDIDPWLEMNNGRILTLYDLGRIPLLQRIGVVPVLRRKGWVGTHAGASVRFRKRLRAFDRYEMRSRLLGWDERFIYSEFSMWRQGACTSHALYRTAITSRTGLVPTADLAQALGIDPQSPPLPAWVVDWIDAEARRPWPPMQDRPVEAPALAG